MTLYSTLSKVSQRTKHVCVHVADGMPPPNISVTINKEKGVEEGAEEGGAGGGGGTIAKYSRSRKGRFQNPSPTRSGDQSI